MACDEGSSVKEGKDDEVVKEKSVIWRERFEWEIEYPVEEVWEITRDFGSMHKWAPTLIANCSVVEGAPQEAGCVRLSQSHPNPSPGHGLEKLVEMDEVSHKFSYVVLDSSFPFLVGLSACFHLVPAHSPSSPYTTLIWSYEIAPVPGFDQMSFRHFLLSNIYEVFISDLKKTLSLAHSS